MTSSENITVLRLIEGRLAVCVQGSEEQPRWLDGENALSAFVTASSQRRESVVFAAPGEDVRLQRLTITPEEKKHLTKSLPYMLEEQLAGDVEQATVDPAEAATTCTSYDFTDPMSVMSFLNATWYGGAY